MKAIGTVHPCCVLKKRFKTVDLLVAERDWNPVKTPVASDQLVGLRVAFAEGAVRHRVKQAGGNWNPERRVWELRYDRVVALGLNNRIVDEPASTGDRCRPSLSNSRSATEAPF